MTPGHDSGSPRVLHELPGEKAEAEGFEPSMGGYPQTALAERSLSSAADCRKPWATSVTSSEGVHRLVWTTGHGARPTPLVPAMCHPARRRGVIKSVHLASAWTKDQRRDDRGVSHPGGACTNA